MLGNLALLRTRLCLRTCFQSARSAERISNEITKCKTPRIAHNRQTSQYHTVQRCEKDFLKPCSRWRAMNFVFLSGHFVKLKEVPEPKNLTRFNRDAHYEQVKSQNFGPIPVSESDVPEGHYALTSWKYAERDHLEYGGIPYHKLPIARIEAKYNNTFIGIYSHDYSKLYAFVTCGMVGFKNAKKKTTHAAETVGKGAADRAVLRECPEHVRVKIKGPGYGRAGAIRGLVMGGMTIVSVTDITPLHVDGLPQRPRKIRRI